MKYCWKEIGTRGESESVSCIWLCEPMDCSLPGSSVCGILQARVLEWVAISFSRGSSWLRNRTQVSSTAGRCLTIWATREALAPIGPVQIKIKQKFREIKRLWSQDLSWGHLFAEAMGLQTEFTTTLGLCQKCKFGFTFKNSITALIILMIKGETYKTSRDTERTFKKIQYPSTF